ncbi:MAG: hypothetical protein RLZZ174_2156, partial [Pseudomonadota bacterium]
MTHLRILSALAPAIVALALSAPSAADPKAALLQDLNA